MLMNTLLIMKKAIMNSSYLRHEVICWTAYLAVLIAISGLIYMITMSTLLGGNVGENCYIRIKNSPSAMQHPEYYVISAPKWRISEILATADSPERAIEIKSKICKE